MIRNRHLKVLRVQKGAARPKKWLYCSSRELRGGAMLALVVVLLLAMAIGFIVGYGVREIISRRRRAAAEERFRNKLSSDPMPRLE